MSVPNVSSNNLTPEPIDKNHEVTQLGPKQRPPGLPAYPINAKIADRPSTTHEQAAMHELKKKEITVSRNLLGVNVKGTLDTVTQDTIYNGQVIPKKK